MEVIERSRLLGDEGYGQITGRDSYLVEIGLNPADAFTHPALTHVPAEDLERYIDDIYISANAGDDRAKALIFLAGIFQADFSDVQAIDPLPIDISLSIQLAEIEAVVLPGESIEDRGDAIALLDRSIAAIEMTVEDFNNGLLTK